MGLLAILFSLNKLQPAVINFLVADQISGQEGREGVVDREGRAGEREVQAGGAAGSCESIQVMTSTVATSNSG